MYVFFLFKLAKVSIVLLLTGMAMTNLYINFHATFQLWFYKCKDNWYKQKLLGMLDERNKFYIYRIVNKNFLNAGTEQVMIKTQNLCWHRTGPANAG